MSISRPATRPHGRLARIQQQRAVARAIVEVVEPRRLLAAADLDPSFGDAGIFLSPSEGLQSVADLTARADASGRVYIAGTVTRTGEAFNRDNQFDLLVRRYRADGSIDRNFGNNGQTLIDLGGDETAVSIDVSPSGAIVVTGTQLLNARRKITITRLRAGGQFERNFGDAGSVLMTFSARTSAEAFGAVFDAQDRVVFAGNVLRDGRKISQAMGRLRVDGTLDPSFSSDGLMEVRLGKDEVFVRGTLLVSPDGSLYVGGAMQTKRGAGGFRFAQGAFRVLENGSLDQRFADAGVFRSPESIQSVPTPSGRDFRLFAPAAIEASGNLLLAGTQTGVFDGTDFINQARIIRLSPRGEVTTEGGTLNINVGGETAAVGIVATAGGVYLQTAGAENAVRRIVDGAVDSTFGAGGIASLVAPPAGSYRAEAIVTGSAGEPIAVGRVEYKSEPLFVETVALHRFSRSGAPDQSFGAGGIAAPIVGGVAGQYDALLELPGGRILGAGFTFGAGGQDFLLRVHRPDGSIDRTFGEDGARIIDFGGAERAFALALQQDGKMLIGGTGLFDGKADFVLARIMPDGTLDRTFDRDGRVRTQAGAQRRERIIGIHVQPDGKIIAGGPSERRSALVRYNSDGSLDRTFGDQGLTVVKPLATDSGLPMIGFGVRADGTIAAAAARLARPSSFPDAIVALLSFDRNGRPDNSFGGDGRRDTSMPINYFDDQPVFPFAVDRDGRFVVVSHVGGSYLGSFARMAAFDRNGNSAAGFESATLRFAANADNNFGGFLDDVRGYEITDIAVTSSGRIVAFGGGGNVNYPFVQPVVGVYNPNGSPDFQFNGGAFKAYPVAESFYATGTLVMSDGTIVGAGVSGGRPVLIRVRGDTEPRSVAATLNDGRLIVRGSKFNDDIELTRDGDEVVVRVNADIGRFAAADVRQIVVEALQGNDRVLLDDLRLSTSVYGGSGNDTLTVAGRGRMLLEGGAGDDQLTGGTESCTLIGAAGNDSLTGGQAGDLFSGGAGFDCVDYGSRATHLIITNENIANDGASGERDDVQSNVEWIIAGSGADRVMLATQSVSRIDGGAGDDTLTLGDGGGTILGAEGNDRITGGDGDDFLDAGDGNDTINGRAGDDVVLGRLGSDEMFGGDGVDRTDYSHATVGVRVELNNQPDDGAPGERDNVHDDVEAIGGSNANDLIIGSNGADRLLGGDGDDTLLGLGGSDFLDGGSGNNSVLGGDGDDSLFAGQGSDTLRGGSGNDHLSGGGGFVGQSPVSAFTGVRNRAGKDQLFGDDGDDYFSEYDYNDDTINGGTGLDTARRDRDNRGANDLLISIEKTLGIGRYPE